MRKILFGIFFFLLTVANLLAQPQGEWDPLSPHLSGTPTPNTFAGFDGDGLIGSVAAPTPITEADPLSIHADGTTTTTTAQISFAFGDALYPGNANYYTEYYNATGNRIATCTYTDGVNSPPFYGIDEGLTCRAFRSTGSMSYRLSAQDDVILDATDSVILRGATIYFYGDVIGGGQLGGRDLIFRGGEAGKSVRVQSATPTATPAVATNPNDLFIEGRAENVGGIYHKALGAAAGILKLGADGSEAIATPDVDYLVTPPTPQPEPTLVATPTPNPANVVNPMTTAGDIIVAGASGTPNRLAGTTTTTVKYLMQRGSGSVPYTPSWVTPVPPTPITIPSYLGECTKAAVANQACRTTCSSTSEKHCSFGQNTATYALVDCADSTADWCCCYK